MLEHFGRTSGLGSLVGDLAEEYADGRSRAWYWRQVVGAFAIGYLRALGTHSPSFILAVVSGCALTAAWHLANTTLFRPVPVYAGLWRVSQHPWTVEGLLQFGGWLLNQASVLGLAFASTSVVTRVHRAHQRAVLVAFVAVLTVPRIPWITRLAVDFGGNARFAPYLEHETIGVLFQAVLALAAGLWVIQTQRFSAMNTRIRWAALFVVSQLLAGAMIVAASRTVGLSPLRPFAQNFAIVQLASLAYLAFLLWKPPMAHGSNPESAHPQTH
jgi:hypothetical protein